MFDIGFLELVIVSVVGLLVLGPERLPGAIRTVMAYVNKIRRSFAGIRAEIERELKADEIRQDLHNQAIMQQLRQTEKELRQGLGVDEMKIGKDGYPAEEADTPAAQDSVNPDPTDAKANKP
jgi:sec-independent protein translocase protein TatB